MNGVHDMGGMHGMGRVPHEKSEPVFHAWWEARVYALTRAMRAHGRWNLDADRHEIEGLAPADYLRMSYYERWLAALMRRMVKTGTVTAAEVERGTPDAGAREWTPALTASMTSRFLDRSIPSADDPSVRPHFGVGQHVRARMMHPSGHTRLPRYVRGKSGTIVRDHGVYAFPDTNAHGLGEKRQHVYSVRFAARELWEPDAPARDCVHLDLWDDYLEPA
jgi:nitrile hydratase beta subunit